MALALAPQPDPDAPLPGPSCESSSEKTCRQTIPRLLWRTWCVGCRQALLVERVAVWLRLRASPEVLSLTSYDEGGGSGTPDRRYDPVAAEADLERAMASLPPLERTAGELSKGIDRGQRGWYGWVNATLRHRVGPQWVAWQEAVTERGQRLPEGATKPRPFEALLDRVAQRMADILGPDWL